jgi:hypothetical protein
VVFSLFDDWNKKIRKRFQKKDAADIQLPA